MLTLGLSLPFSLLAVEIGLRIFGVSHPLFHFPDEHLGYSPRPGARGWYRDEGEAFIEINSYGMRDREHTAEKSPDALRIAVLGDSYCDAIQVPVEKTFWSCLEGELNSRNGLRGKKVEVLNFGVSGYGTAQELLMLKQRVWRFSPDMILLAFTTANDIRNNSKTLEPNKMRPFFVLDGERLALDNDFLNLPGYKIRTSGIGKTLYALSDYSRIIQVCRAVNGRYQQRKQLEQSKQQAEAVNNGEEAGLEEWIYQEPKNSTHQEAWEITARILRMMRDECDAHGARLAVVTLSNQSQVHPDPQFRHKEMERLGVQDLFYPERRLKAILDAANVPVLNLAPELERYAQEHQIFLHGFRSSANLGRGHWNENGHRLAGDLIASWLATETPSKISGVPERSCGR